MEQIEILNERYEQLIANAFFCMAEIQDLEEKHGPAPHISDIAQVYVGMMFVAMLIRHKWDQMEAKKIPQKKREEIIEDMGNRLHDFIKDLSTFDARETLKRVKK